VSALESEFIVIERDKLHGSGFKKEHCTLIKASVKGMM
jgi:hypothetical protein